MSLLFVILDINLICQLRYVKYRRGKMIVIGYIYLYIVSLEHYCYYQASQNCPVLLYLIGPLKFVFDL